MHPRRAIFADTSRPRDRVLGVSTLPSCILATTNAARYTSDTTLARRSPVSCRTHKYEQTYLRCCVYSHHAHALAHTQTIGKMRLTPPQLLASRNSFSLFWSLALLSFLARGFGSESTTPARTSGALVLSHTARFEPGTTCLVCAHSCALRMRSDMPGRTDGLSRRL